MNETSHSEDDPLELFQRQRSEFVRGLVQETCKKDNASTAHTETPPKRIIQFWDSQDEIPIDVRECMESWGSLEEKGFELLLFDEFQSRKFIRNSLGSRYLEAFDKCYHPAMQSDYFRLCYIFVMGGFYVDADDVYRGIEIEHLFRDGRLKIQPLCYDILKDEMVPLSVFTSPGINSFNWIFYFNNNPLIAPQGHPIIKRALLNATASLEKYSIAQLPDIQSTAGPGNLTRTIFDLASNTEGIEDKLLVLYDWESIARTKWALSYRDDERNWRLSDGKRIESQLSKQTESR